MPDSAPKRNTVSAFVVCCNEERNIGRCLESVKWCDEIIAIDSGSTDKTKEICKSYGAKIHERAWPGFVEQKRYGFEQCSSEWVLNIDADEEVSPELKDEMLSHLSKDTTINGYELSRVVFYLGKWWRKGGWYPEYRLRLCRKSETSWGGDEPHEKAFVKGPTLRLRGELRHYTYDDMTHHMRSLNNFARTAALTMQKKGRRFSIFSLLIHPPSRFIKYYFIKRGFLEGFPGLLVACFETWYVFLKYVNLWELERRAKAS